MENHSFVSKAADTLRKELSAIRDATGLLLAQNASEETRRIIGRIDTSSVRLGRLVGDILDGMQIEDGTLRVETYPMDIIAILDEAVLQVRPSAENKSLAFVYDKPPTVSQIMGDPTRLLQAFVQLLENAVQYTKSGSITVRVEDRSMEVAVIIEDTGIGIPESDRGHLFEKFFESSDLEAEHATSTGLGLWIVKELIKRMEGVVSVQSTVGKGTKVEVAFPALST